MGKSILAAVVQLRSGPDVARNLARCRALVGRAAARGATFVVLPENFAHIGRLEDTPRLAERLDGEGPIVGAMRELARRHRVHLLLGGLPTPAAATGRCHNTAALLDPLGAVRAAYHKIHLFDVDIPGGAVFEESRVIAAGPPEPVVADIPGARLGLSICYDLRFPELYRALVDRGADTLCVPAAFTLHTGRDHWLPLLRARAIENQAYVLAAGQWGRHFPGRESYGRSCVVDPWGTVLAQVPDGEGIALAEIDPAALARVRRQLPCLRHRRL